MAMDKRTNATDTNDKGHSVRDLHEAPLPDARSVEDETLEPARDPATEIRTGDQTGQTTRGSYGTDSVTGAGKYMDHIGTFSNRPVAQPGTDQDEEAEVVDPIN